MGLINKITNFISPKKAFQRFVIKEAIKIYNSGYGNYGASTTKSSMKGWISTGGGVNKDIYKNKKKLIERSRDLFMGAPIARGALNTINTNVVGAGLKLKSSIDYESLGINEEEAEKIETQIEKEFKLWSESKIDNQELSNFYQIQDLVLLTVLLSGECFIKLNYFKTPKNPYLLKLQIIEPDRIATPSIYSSDKSVVEGARLDKNGWIEGYYIYNKHPLDESATEYTYVKVYGKEEQLNLIHLLSIERPEQLRGIPVLSPVIETLKQLDRYTEAELMAAIVSGLYAVFIEQQGTEDNHNTEELDVLDDKDKVAQEEDDKLELAPGMIVSLKPGEKATSLNPGRPNAQFDPFVTSILRQIGTALEVPFELLIKHFSASYSASRASLLEAWKMFRKRREWFAGNFNQVVYEEWLREAVLNGRLDLKGYGDDVLINKAWASAQWNGPSQGQIDPLKEAKASVTKINNGLSTRTRETVELNGGDFEQNARILGKESKILEEKGVKLENAKDDEVLEHNEE